MIIYRHVFAFKTQACGHDQNTAHTWNQTLSMQANNIANESKMHVERFITFSRHLPFVESTVRGTYVPLVCAMQLNVYYSDNNNILINIIYT